ncbi:tetratricopeptide repeat protein [Pseudomonas sp. DWP3-1-2]|uniref:tetratricopeptide repeat protein n=1 Tax=Pseudomonas sp. DWP3-1-2 TaxID=2804645 RepID=UPI003CE67DB6
MTWNLQRKEVLDGDQLRAMLAEHPAKAAQAIIGAAADNLVEAQALLGQILLDGRGIERDPKLALTWFDIAARKGHLMARNMMGRCFEHGWGCSADPARAAAHYEQAAKAGLDWSLYNLGNLLATGRGVAQDQKRALQCYRRAAQLGHAKSMNLLGRYLEDGVFCQQDLPAAYDWYRRSAEGGDFRGQFSHAAVLADHGMTDEALVWLQLALKNGNLNFLRVSRTLLLSSAHPPIKALALDYHRRAAELGDESDSAQLRSMEIQVSTRQR